MPELVKAWQESEADYSSRLSDLQKKLERRLSSSKTSQQLELADFEKSSEHLPKWGMTVDGRVYLPQALGPHIRGKGGSYLPTPNARDWKDNGKSPAELQRNSTTLATLAGGKLNPQWVEWLMGYCIGHTELNALGTQWFQSKSGKRLKS